jgi:hypothetical protein
LEIKTVSEQSQEAQAGRYRITGGRYTLLKDPTTRVPALFAGLSCSDPLYQESLWFLAPGSTGNLHSMRCIRPFFFCRFAPPMMIDEAPSVVGPAISLRPPEGGAAR